MTVDQDKNEENGWSEEWDPDVSHESDFGEPKCPRCGEEMRDMYELFMDDASESETECGSCELKLTATAEYSVDYTLSYSPPTPEQVAAEEKRRIKSEADEEARVARLVATAPARKRAAAEKAARLEACAKSWPEHSWPSWVPAELRSLIESRWSGKWNDSGPFGWMEAARQYPTKTGDQVAMGVDTCDEVHGRFVYAWGNIGRVVDDLGGIHYCCVHGAHSPGVSGWGRTPKPSPTVAEASAVVPAIESRPNRFV